MERVLPAYPLENVIASTLSEPSSDARYEFGKNLLTLGPVDHCAPVLKQESGSRRAGELRWRPFDKESAITPDQGNVRQVSAVRPCSEKVPGPPKFSGIQPIVFAESSGRRCIAPAANGMAQGGMKGKTARAFLERKKSPGSHEPVRNGGKRHVDTVANGIRTVQEIATDVFAVYPERQLGPRRVFGEISALPGRRERLNTDCEAVAVSDQHCYLSLFTKLRYSDCVRFAARVMDASGSRLRSPMMHS